jgi:hypothetical protein
VAGAEELTREQFSALFDDLNRWGTWGRDDERGARNLITPARVAFASGLVRDGVTVTLSLPVNTHAGAHNPKPADHHMTALASHASDASPVHFIKDYVGADYHHDGHCHIDALCHVGYEGTLYNSRPERAVTEHGATVNSIAVLKNGLVGRGVLLDVPRAGGVAWLEPGEHVFPADIEAAESMQGVTVHEGDILLVRTGHARRLAELGPWNTAEAKAGLFVDPLLAEVAEQRTHPGAECQPSERDEEQQAEQQPPEPAPGGAAPGGRAAVRRVDVVLALEITRDRGHLVGLDDQLRLELEDRLPGPLSGFLVRIADRNQRCHYRCLLS